MRQTPELNRIQERMKAGEMTLHGFLGNDDRNLADILMDDHQVVVGRGLSHARIADRLQELAEKGANIMEEEVQVEDRYRVRVRDDRGRIPSPWGDGLFPKSDVSLTDTITGKSFRFNGLTIHLIRNHGFYGGRGSEYRIDPADIIEALNLELESPDAGS